jgi:hypothetical protein
MAKQTNAAKVHKIKGGKVPPAPASGKVVSLHPKTPKSTDNTTTIHTTTETETTMQNGATQTTDETTTTANGTSNGEANGAEASGTAKKDPPRVYTKEERRNLMLTRDEVLKKRAEVQKVVSKLLAEVETAESDIAKQIFEATLLPNGDNMVVVWNGERLRAGRRKLRNQEGFNYTIDAEADEAETL